MEIRDDLISRAAAIEAFMGKPPEYYHTSYIVGEINCLPSVDAAPVRHGRWLNRRFNPVCCSVCGITPNALRGTTVQPDFHYCPYCGARMDGDKNAVD